MESSGISNCHSCVIVHGISLHLLKGTLWTNCRLLPSQLCQLVFIAVLFSFGNLHLDNSDLTLFASKRIFLVIVSSKSHVKIAVLCLTFQCLICAVAAIDESSNWQDDKDTSNNQSYEWQEFSFVVDKKIKFLFHIQIFIVELSWSKRFFNLFILGHNASFSWKLEEDVERCSPD